ncbi:MAG TPA: hypothetical protein VK966_11065 [Longimicrobiales bacterium]|nr:hypothetical protein [Longimicrobiales bacterium]
MRRFTDPEGRTWDVVVGRESFGAFLALFIPAAGTPAGNRQALLGAESRADADSELGALDEAGLNELLQRSEPKTG